MYGFRSFGETTNWYVDDITLSSRRSCNSFPETSQKFESEKETFKTKYQHLQKEFDQKCTEYENLKLELETKKHGEQL